MSKFKVSANATRATPAPGTIEDFAAGAAMVRTQTAGRPLKPVRLNFDLDPATHHRLRQRALDRGMNVATLVRQLIRDELSK